MTQVILFLFLCSTGLTKTDESGMYFFNWMPSLLLVFTVFLYDIPSLVLHPGGARLSVVDEDIKVWVN